MTAVQEATPAELTCHDVCASCGEPATVVVEFLYSETRKEKPYEVEVLLCTQHFELGAHAIRKHRGQILVDERGR